MNISYKRTLRESYMVVEKGDDPINYEERMLKENEIRSLLSFYTMQSDGKTQFWYGISGKQSLKDYLEKEEISLALLERMLTCIMIAFDELHKYLIRDDNILLGPETVYLNRQDQLRVFLCYCPNAAVHNKPFFQEMMEYVVEKVSGKEEELVQLCYRLYEMSMQSDTTLRELHELLESEIQSQMDKVIVEEPIEFLQPPQDISIPEQMGQDKEDIYYVPPWEKMLQQVNKKGQGILEMIAGWGRHKTSQETKEDFVIEPAPEATQPTQLLYQESRACQGRLLYQGTKGEKDYIISKACFRIGHGDMSNDACLSSDAVSHSHAKIEKQEESYYIEDLNSTNGTYVNGQPLSYTEKRKLKPMDFIHFADVSYMFL